MMFSVHICMNWVVLLQLYPGRIKNWQILRFTGTGRQRVEFCSWLCCSEWLCDLQEAILVGKLCCTSSPPAPFFARLSLTPSSLFSASSPLLWDNDQFVKLAADPPCPQAIAWHVLNSQITATDQSFNADNLRLSKAILRLASVRTCILGFVGGERLLLDSFRAWSSGKRCYRNDLAIYSEYSSRRQEWPQERM